MTCFGKLLAALCLTTIATPAIAAQMFISTLDDELNSDGDCSLREAVRAANLNQAVDGCPAGHPTDYDVILLMVGTHTLTITGAGENYGVTGDLDIRGSTAIAGAGSGVSIIDASALGDRAIEIKPPDGTGSLPAAANIDAYVQDVEITGGTSAGNQGGAIAVRAYTPPIGSRLQPNVIIGDAVLRANSATVGGAIFNEGGTAVRRCVLTGNVAAVDGGAITGPGPLLIEDSTLDDNELSPGTAAAGGGGAIFVNGLTTITGSTISNNNAGAGAGGGIACQNAVLTIQNSTISGNTGSGQGGGGIIQGLNGSNPCPISVDSTTITDNSGSTGGGWYVSAGSSEVRNTIIAGNTATGAGPDVQGAFGSNGFNLIGDATGSTGFVNTGDVTGTTASPIDAGLESLGDYGGLTLTHVLAEDSPGRDTGACSLDTDQRGAARPDTLCDRGSVEGGPLVDASACPAEPVTGCAAAEKSSLLITGAEKPKLLFKLGAADADAIEQSGFGDPTATDTYVLCVYDSSGPAGAFANKLAAVVDAIDGWKALSTKGYAYSNKAGNDEGITAVKLLAGKPGKPKAPKLQIKGAGAALDDVLPPALTLPVRAQILRDGGGCWEDSYTSAGKNEEDSFKAKR